MPLFQRYPFFTYSLAVFSSGFSLNSSTTLPTGKRLPGRLGNARATVKQLKIVKIDEQKNLLLIHGSIPGAKNGLVIIRQAK